MTAATADVVVIGGGIIGLAAAYQMARRSDLRIVVLEKGAGVGEGSTGASSAVLRHRYSRDEMVQLSRDGLRAYRNWPAFTGLTSPRGRFHETGVLWFTGDDQFWAAREHTRMSGFDIPVEILDDTDLCSRFPALSACCLAPDTSAGVEHRCRGGGRHLLESSGGYTDPVACMVDLLEACQREGVVVRFATTVKQILASGGRVGGVVLADGDRLSAPVVVNANGPWVNDLLEPLGLALPWTLVPTRVQVLYLDRPDVLHGNIPVCVDVPAGIYFREQNLGQQLVLGSVREEDERESIANPDEFERMADDTFIQATLHALHHRLPDLPYRGKVRSYCGLYTVNREDVHPLVGASGLEGLYLANGFSGHGFKIAPAVGSLLAQAVTGTAAEFDTGVAPAFLAPARQPIVVDDMSVLA